MNLNHANATTSEPQDQPEEHEPLIIEDITNDDSDEVKMQSTQTVVGGKQVAPTAEPATSNKRKNVVTTGTDPARHDLGHDLEKMQQEYKKHVQRQQQLKELIRQAQNVVLIVPPTPTSKVSDQPAPKIDGVDVGAEEAIARFIEAHYRVIRQTGFESMDPPYSAKVSSYKFPKDYTSQT